MAITFVPDNSITRHVQGRIVGRGLGAPCRITVATAKGEVTLSGTVRFAQQKTTAVQAANGVAGVRRVIDRLEVKSAGKH